MGDSAGLSCKQTRSQNDASMNLVGTAVAESVVALFLHCRFRSDGNRVHAVTRGSSRKC